MVRLPDFEHNLRDLAVVQICDQFHEQPGRNSLSLGFFSDGDSLQLSLRRDENCHQKAEELAFRILSRQCDSRRNRAGMERARVEVTRPARRIFQAPGDFDHPLGIGRLHGPNAEGWSIHDLISVSPKISASERRR